MLPKRGRSASSLPLVRVVPEAVPDNRYNDGMLKQTTILQSVRATGVGLHTGRKVVMNLRPAPVNTGVVFRRMDLPGTPDVPAELLSGAACRSSVCRLDVKWNPAQATAYVRHGPLQPSARAILAAAAFGMADSTDNGCIRLVFFTKRSV